MQNRAALVALVILSGCTSLGQRIDRLAASYGMSRSIVQAQGYRSLIYMNRERPGDGAGLMVFLEGDGRPWREGLEPNTEPTTKNPIALKLMAGTPHAAAYVSRPCYHELLVARCTPDRWTSARYAEDIVASMAEAIAQARARAGARDVTLVGYSGGGALAVLVAERLEHVAGVVTIAANLDTDAWTRHHHYRPLSGSLNPARSERDHPWPELHFHGARDPVVPAATSAAYFDRYPAARHVILEEYDHVCCWADEWPVLLPQIAGGLGLTF